MAKNILICPDLQQEHGHWRPVMALARKLLVPQPAHNIKFFGFADCKAILAGTSFSFQSVFEKQYPVGYTSLSYDDPDTFYSRTSDMYKIATGEFDVLFNSFEPHILLAGYFIAPEALMIYYRYRTRFFTELKPVITTTYLRHPTDDPAAFAMRFFLQISQETAAKLMQTVTGDMSFTGDRESILRFVQPLQETTELVFCPQEFDFPHFKTDPMFQNNNIIDIRNYIEASMMEVLPYPPVETPPPGRYKGKLYVFASAGSRVRDYIDEARNMFTSLIEMMDDKIFRNMNLVLSVGYSLKKEFEELTAKKRNVFIVDWTNQTEMIKGAMLVFTHGGLASVKECIYYDKPFVVIPLGKDQRENALRVQDAGVGVMLHPDKLSTINLCNASKTVVDSIDIAKKRSRLKTVFIERENTKPGFSIIQTLLGESV